MIRDSDKNCKFGLQLYRRGAQLPSPPIWGSGPEYCPLMLSLFVAMLPYIFFFFKFSLGLCSSVSLYRYITILDFFLFNCALPLLICFRLASKQVAPNGEKRQKQEASSSSLIFIILSKERLQLAAGVYKVCNSPRTGRVINSKVN